eukprot:scaffold194427_cov40-Tisochrysis_lutea.AAC.1
MGEGSVEVVAQKAAAGYPEGGRKRKGAGSERGCGERASAGGRGGVEGASRRARETECARRCG